MKKTFDITISETRVTTRRCLVIAKGRKEAEKMALSGNAVFEGPPESSDARPKRSVIKSSKMPVTPSDFTRIKEARSRNDAFTMTARIWTPDGIGPVRGYRVEAIRRRRGKEVLILIAGDTKNTVVVPQGHLFDLKMSYVSGEIAYLVSDIEYDTDGSTSTVDLPEEIEILLNPDVDSNDVEELLGDAISDRTGWCHKGFKYEVAP